MCFWYPQNHSNTIFLIFKKIGPVGGQTIHNLPVPAGELRPASSGRRIPTTSSSRRITAYQLRRPSAAGHFLPAICCRPSSAGHLLPAISCRPSPAGHFLPALCCRPSPADHFLPTISCQPSPAADHLLLTISCQPSAAGNLQSKKDKKLSQRDPN